MAQIIGPPDWMGPVEGPLYSDLVSYDPVVENDADLQTLFHQAMFVEDMSESERAEWRESLVDYLMGEYGIDFLEAMDWETFRAWYG